jgi:hypothetical protein
MRLLPIALLAASLAAPVFAQEDDGSTIRLEKPSIHVVSDCDRPEGLCLRTEREKRLVSGARRAQVQSGALSKFAHLAGMFMGRQDAAELGAFKFRFVLDLR